MLSVSLHVHLHVCTVTQKQWLLVRVAFLNLEILQQLVWIIVDARYLFDCKVILLDRDHYFALLTMMCPRNVPVAKHFVLWPQPSFMQKNTC